MITVFVAPPVSGVACTSTSVTVEGNLGEIKVDAGSRHSHLIHARARLRSNLHQEQTAYLISRSERGGGSGRTDPTVLALMRGDLAAGLQDSGQNKPRLKQTCRPQQERRYNTDAGLSKHALRLFTLKGDDVARDEELEVGAGHLEKVLDVSPGRQLVFLLHLFGAAGLVLGHTHLEVGL